MELSATKKIFSLESLDSIPGVDKADHYAFNFFSCARPQKMDDMYGEWLCMIASAFLRVGDAVYNM